MLAIFTILLAALAYTAAYLYCLGLRIIRQKLDDKASAFLLALVVSWAVLTAVITLEAVLLIGVARPVSGSLFYVASGFGVFLAFMAAAGVTGLPKPIAIALAHNRAAVYGTMGGNIVLLAVNALSFLGMVPTVL